MAKSANADAVSDAIRPADFRGSVQLIRTIPAKKEKIQSLNGEIGDIWGKIEGKKVNKEAGKFFAKLDKKEEVERNQIVRDLMKLIDAAGWDVGAKDLVDLAEAAPPKKGKATEPAEPDDDVDMGGEDDADGDPEPSAKAAAKVTPIERMRAAREKVQEQLGDGSARH